VALTLVAIAASKPLSDRLFNPQTDIELNDELIRSIIFSHSAIRTIGLAKQQASP